MKPDKHLVGALGIILTAIGLIALTWVGTMRAIHVQQQENLTRVNAILTNQALTLTEQVNRQLLALDQTLRMLVTAWETNPGAFDLEVLRSQAVVLNGISRDMILTDEAGIIRQSSVVPAINLDVSATDFFRDLADPYRSGDRMFVGPASIGAIMRQWHMDVARALHHQDGSFAGVISADYRIAAMTDIFRQTDLGALASSPWSGWRTARCAARSGRPRSIPTSASPTRGCSPRFSETTAACGPGRPPAIWRCASMPTGVFPISRSSWLSP